MSPKFDDFSSLFSTEDNAAFNAAQKASQASAAVVERVAREKIAVAGELLDLGVKQFGALTESRTVTDVVEANQAWFSGYVDVISSHSEKLLKVFQDASADFEVAAATKPAKAAKAA